MSDQIKKLDIPNVKEGYWDITSRSAINQLIDHLHALEKRVEGLERHEHFKNNGAMFIPYKEKRL